MMSVAILVIRCTFFSVLILVFNLIHVVAQDSEFGLQPNPSEENSIHYNFECVVISASNMSRRLGHGMDNVTPGQLGG